jgi:hypothetical protein
LRRILRATHGSASIRVLSVPAAQIGLFTSIVEGAATAVAAGVVLSSVAMGLMGMALGWSRQELAVRTLTDGYVGGLLGGVLAVVDILIRYGPLK